LIAAGDGAVRGAGYPILGFGIAHLAAGVFIQVTSRVRRRVFDVAIDRAPDAWARVEAARMRGVSKQFLALKIAWVALAAGGIAMAVIARREDRPTLEGVGYGLAIDAGATLVFDIFAARRAHRYRSAL
jgi:succinate dehydrogenase/fumarate reductase flavoprotein subunit